MQNSELSFMDQLKNTLLSSGHNHSVTENGAVGYRTTGRKLLDLNFMVSSMRNMTEDQIITRYAEACMEDIDRAIVWLFFVRDVRGGMGERRVFRVCMKYLASRYPDKVRKLVPLIAEYGRWDDLFCLFKTNLQDDMVGVIRRQLTSDMASLEENKPISLLAKWMPSENSSSKSGRRSALAFCNVLNLKPRQYRLMLSRLRSKNNIVESKMSTNQWNKIDYSAVPSRANLVYNSAFLRHDEQRRREFLGKVESGEEKINSSTLFPHDIAHKYCSTSCGYGYKYRMGMPDPAIEALWNALPNVVEENGSTIVVADGSGSMTQEIGKTKISALTVANALAIYFSQHLSGPYKDKYITFSTHPQLVDLSGAKTLLDKLHTARRYNEVSDTNVEAVFDLILETAVRNKLAPDQLPKNILILSDMEFNSCARNNGYRHLDSTLFDNIAKSFKKHGYQMPRLVFWNICSRTGTIPVTQNALGVALVSGFSPAVSKMVMSNHTDPYLALLETLEGERYAPIWEILSKTK